MYKVIELADKSYEVLIDGESVYYPCYDDLPPSAKDRVNKMIKTKKMSKITICKGYKKSKYDNTCMNCNSNKSYCEYTRTINQKKSKFKKAGEQSGFDMRGLN